MSAKPVERALRKYGRHLPGCSFKEWECSQPDCGETHRTDCNCGFETALSAAPASAIKCICTSDIVEQLAAYLGESLSFMGPWLVTEHAWMEPMKYYDNTVACHEPSNATKEKFLEILDKWENNALYAIEDALNDLRVFLRQQRKPDSKVDVRREPRWFVVADGEGAEAKPIYEADPHQAVHDFMCVCGNPWDKCTTDGMAGDVRQIDNEDEWATDEDGKPFSTHWKHECGTVSLYRVAAASAVQGTREKVTIDQRAPRCPTHGEWMILSFYDRPGSPPGNSWTCRSCAAERRAALQAERGGDRGAHGAPLTQGTDRNSDLPYLGERRNPEGKAEAECQGSSKGSEFEPLAMSVPVALDAYITRLESLPASDNLSVEFVLTDAKAVRDGSYNPHLR